MTEAQAANKRWVTPFAATLFGMMALQISSLGFAPLLPRIQQAFGMSYSQIGLFTGVYGLLAIVMSVPAGLAAKYFGEKRVLIMGLLVVALGLGALSMANSFTNAFLGRGLWITGYRFAFVCILTAIGSDLSAVASGTIDGNPRRDVVLCVGDWCALR